MEPKRWGLENCMMLQDDCGQFVDIEDYERMESDLRRQLAEVTAGRDRLKENFKNYVKNEYRNHDNISLEEITVDHTKPLRREE